MAERGRRSRAALAAAVSVVLVCWFAGSAAEAADQTEHLTATPAVLASAGKYINEATGELTYEKARSLVRVVFPEESTDSADFYCAIHVLRWGDEPSAIDQSRWYIYRGRGSRASTGGSWTPARFEEARIFGTDRLAFLYVHLNVPATTREAAEKAVPEEIARIKALPEGSSTELTPAQLLTETGPTERLKVRGSGNSLLQLGSFIVDATYARVSYQLDIVKKLPSPIQNLQDALGILQGAAAEDASIPLESPVALYASAVYDIRHVPSDITISGKLTNKTALETKTVELGKQTYDNEGLYYWDVSLGIPIRSITQLNFETSGGEVFAKEVDATHLMALLNIYWRPVDTKNTRSLLLPSPIVGVALSKRPLSKMLVGLSIGLTRVQFYGARQWTQLNQPPATGAESDEDTPTAVAKYRQDWVFGINVPVRQVIDFLKAKK